VPISNSQLACSIEKHAQYTKSQKAIAVLANWDEMVPKFVKVMPRDYKRVLQAIQNALASGLSGDDALNAAFEENSHDVARIGGVRFLVKLALYNSPHLILSTCVTFNLFWEHYG
jgi:hypothetical protein